MLKYIIFIIFLFFICWEFWIIQIMLILITFLFLLNLINFDRWSKISYLFGVDFFSFSLILLRIWIRRLIILASYNVYNFKINLIFFIFNVVFILIILYCVFRSINLFIFYLFFEVSLIPILLLILGWGYQPERIQAGMYLLFYTLFISLPILIGIFYIYEELNSLIIYFIKNLDLNYYYIFFLIILSFLVKMPIIFIHLWLPKAHVEAPVSGSIILAGIILKLGGYGLIRILILFQSLLIKINYLIISLSLIGRVYISLMCLHQIDLKSLVAYSSVVHMGLVLGGLIVLSFWGFSGSYVILVGHGLCSSGLFCLVNLNYERFYRRRFYINKGMLNFFPSLTLWWFLLLRSNIAAPPSLNLLGEISLLNSLISWSFLMIIILIFLSFFSVLYRLFLFIYRQYGKYCFNLNNFYFNSCREFLLLLLHWFPLNVLILKVDLFIIFF